MINKNIDIPINREMKIILIIPLFTVFFSLNLWAIDEYDYDELLEKHLQSGHLTDAEIDEQKFEMINSKKYQNEFSRQVRGVASKLDDHKNVLHFVNPEIEIPAN